MAEDKVDRLEARTVLSPVELDAQREAAAPVAQPQAVVAAAAPVAQQQAVVAVAAPVAQQQAVATSAMQPPAASVELAATKVVRSTPVAVVGLWFREASFLVRAPE